MIRPEIGLSDIYLNLSVETGTSLEGSFHIYSKNGQELSGKVLSTNDKVVVKVNELSGTECEIPFYFKGKMAIAGEEHFGDFLLLTNGGEYNVPYCVTVIPKKYWFGDRAISDLNDFYCLAQEDWKKAKDIFFTKEFPDILLDQQEEYRILYHDLLKGYSKDVIMDHFLMEVMGKAPARLHTETKEIRIDESKVGRMTLEMEGWGCLDGRIYSESGNLLLNKERLTMEEFEDGKVELFLSLKEEADKDVLIIETVFDRICIPVGRKKLSVDVPGTGEKREKAFSVLLHYYIAFRTGKMTTEEYVGYSLKNLPVKGHFYELYCLLLLLIQSQNDGESEECDKYASQIEEKKNVYLGDEEVRSFYLYVMALWKKEQDFTKEAARQIRTQYEKKGSLYDYLMLTFLDEKTAFEYKEQGEILCSYLEQGENSPLLYLALMDVLNQEPYLLEHLGDRKAEVICWGLRHQYLSHKLIEQFERLALREKNYKKNQLDLLLLMYEKKPDALCLKAICSVLMKGNKTDHQYHKYFEAAVEQKLNLIGLNEFYLRTLDFHTYPLLPQVILYYFHYSNSLDKREKAWLYLDLLLHREECEDIYQNYSVRIEEFVKEQLMEGKMNRYLKQLYEKMLPDLLSETDLMKYLPNIIFKKKMTCDNPVMDGVYVCHPENEEEVYVPFIDGSCQVEIYSENARIYFVDRMGNRYHSGISYSLENYLEEEMYREYCLEHCNDNRKVFVKWLAMEEQDKKEALARLLIQNNEGSSWRREKAVERILDYHYEEKAMEELSDCLDQINYRIISPSYRRTLMNYYMACNRMEDAYFGVELYGSDLMEPAQLYLLTCVGLYLHKEEKDDLLLVMAHRTFMNRRYNEEILFYLKTYFEGRIFDLLDIWAALKNAGMEDAGYEERVLEQILFTGSKDDRMYDVLLSYLEKRENDTLAISLLEIYSDSYVCNSLNGKGNIKIPDSYFDVLKKIENKKVPLMIQLAYLIRKSEKGYQESEKTTIRRMVMELCRKQILIPCFEKFESFAPIPSLWKESVCFWFRSEEGKSYTLHVVLEDGTKQREEQIGAKEIGKGFYYGNFYRPLSENIKEKNVPGFDGSVSLLPIGSSVTGSRNQLLWRMQEEKERAGSWMKDYEVIMGRMGEQLRFLGEW